MNGELARELINQYVDGWRNGDIALIIKPLTKSCTVVESHGPTYTGADKIKDWAVEWHKDGGQVKKWVVDSFFMSNKAAFFEWTFQCIADGKNYSIEGASVVLFKGKKINHIHEYRMTYPSYEWSPHG